MTAETAGWVATGAAMTAAAGALVAALDADQQSRINYGFDDDTERTSWAYFPRGPRGLFLYDMHPPQQRLAHALISASLSLYAYAQATTIMSFERLVDLEEGRRSEIRDPGRYSVCMFGSPGADRWGWRFEGHHVVLNFTLEGDQVVSATPLFLGSQPAQVRHRDAVILRPCGEEEDAARTLLLSLDAAQRSVALLTDDVPPDFVLANVPRIPDAADAGPLHPIPHVRARYDELSESGRDALRFERARPAGIAGASMTGLQHELLERLVGVYVDRLPADLASSARSRIDRVGFSDVHFAWAGAQETGKRHYYRLQGRTFLVEYDVTQDDANHVHTVWRDVENDFGYDVLRSHLEREH